MGISKDVKMEWRRVKGEEEERKKKKKKKVGRL